jgi:hypothetical protein
MSLVARPPTHSRPRDSRSGAALLRGVIVVSERTPLVECMPFYPFVVFAAPDDLVASVQRVQREYAATWDRIFGARSVLPAAMQDMRAQAKHDLREVLLRWAQCPRAEGGGTALERTVGQSAGVRR